MGPDYDHWGTPACVFGPAHLRYGFTVDACAARFNAKLPRYWNAGMNALDQDWSAERVWCNPPFSNIGPFVEKARTAQLACLLLPLWGSQPWLGLALEHCDEYQPLGRISYYGRYRQRHSLPTWKSGLFVFRKAD